MRAEKDSEVRKKFLQVAFRLNDETIKQIQNKCKVQVEKKGKDKNEVFNKFINWNSSDNEIALYTLYAYADLKLPKEFSCIFNYRKPEISIDVKVALTQSIWQGSIPIDFIEEGYKHIGIFKFEEKIPDLISKLCLMKQTKNREPNDSIILGICSENHFQEIKNNLLFIEELKKKHGSSWHDFYV